MKNLLILLIASLSLSGCDNINPKNYPFYCKIDGKEFVPEKDNRVPGQLGSSPFRHEFSISGKFLFITTRNSPKEVSILVRLVNEKIEAGSYKLTDDIYNTSYGLFTPNNSTPTLSKSYSETGNVNITKTDGIDKFEGTFEFEMYNEYLGKTIKITEGRFSNY